MCFFPFAPLHMYQHSPRCSLYISYSADKENLFIYQELLRLVIISFIVVTSNKLSVTISV